MFFSCFILFSVADLIGTIGSNDGRGGERLCCQKWYGHKIKGDMRFIKPEIDENFMMYDYLFYVCVPHFFLYDLYGQLHKIQLHAVYLSNEGGGIESKLCCQLFLWRSSSKKYDVYTVVIYAFTPRLTHKTLFPRRSGRQSGITDRCSGIELKSIQVLTNIRWE